MKKFFAIAFIAASLVACNNSGEKKPAEDTTKKADTAVVAPPADTATTPAADTAAVADTAKPKM